MKYKHFKKSLSVLLAMAVFCGVLTSGWLTTEVEANPVDIIPRTMSGTVIFWGVWNSEAVAVNMGDSVNIDLRFTPSVQNVLVTARLVSATGGTVSNTLFITNGRITGTLTAERTGNMRIRIQDNSGLDLFFTRVVTWRLTVRNNDTRVFHDAAYPSPGNLPTIYNNATNAFKNNFAIEFRATHNPTPSDTLNMRVTVPPCHYGRNRPCNDPSAGVPSGRCGGLSLDDCRRDHHKSGAHFITASPIPHPVPDIYIIRMVGFVLCYTSQGHHMRANGVGNVSGKNSVISSTSDNPARTMQHELIHNIGIDIIRQQPLKDYIKTHIFCF